MPGKGHKRSQLCRLKKHISETYSKSQILYVSLRATWGLIDGESNLVICPV